MELTKEQELAADELQRLFHKCLGEVFKTIWKFGADNNADRPAAFIDMMSIMADKIYILRSNMIKHVLSADDEWIDQLDKTLWGIMQHGAVGYANKLRAQNPVIDHDIIVTSLDEFLDHILGEIKKESGQ